MSDAAHLERPTLRKPHAAAAAAIAAAALAAALCVVLANGEPLFYFDTAGYIEQGTTVLRIFLPDAPLVPAGAGSSGVPAGSVEWTLPDRSKDSSVNGSRSTIFAVLLAVLYQTGLLRLFPLICVGIVMAALWLPMRVALRGAEGGPPLWLAVFAPLLAASAGSLPFYAGFLMPDILAAVLVLTCATLVAFAPQMRRRELLLAAGLCLGSVLVHPSHLLIAGVMVPVAALLSLTLRRRGGRVAPLVILAIFLAGAGERVIFRSAVESVTDRQVVLRPFLTARLIADGPGLRHLATRCPDTSIPTCALHEALMRSDDPMRLTATHIVFATSSRLGSFRHLSAAEQKRIADDQLAFAVAVFRHDPFGLVAGMVRNTLWQATEISVGMTVPSPALAQAVSSDLPAAGLGDGRLIESRSMWLPALDRVHQTVYLAALAAIAFLLIRPRSLSREVRLFAVAILLGLATNAFVCGALSQPADRYGARVVWLLPMLAVLLAILARPQGRGAAGPDRADRPARTERGPGDDIF